MIRSSFILGLMIQLGMELKPKERERKHRCGRQENIMPPWLPIGLKADFM
jgi:hypothetical protein